MKAATVHETESIRPTSVETTHTTIHIKGKHYLQFYSPLGFSFLSALPHVKQMLMFMQNQHQQISQQLSLVSSLPTTAYLTKWLMIVTEVLTPPTVIKYIRFVPYSVLSYCGRQNDSLTQVIKKKVHNPYTDCHRKMIPSVGSAPRGGGTLWHTWFRHCSTSREVAASIPDGVIGIFIVIILPDALWLWGRLSL
jgi:hypothetical protein